MKQLLAILILTGLAGLDGRAEHPNAPASSATATNREPTKITSDRLQVDYAHNVGTFEGNVLVIDPQMTLRADKMTVFFSSGTVTNQPKSVQRVIAEGGVVATQEDKKATGEHAEYDADLGKVVLTGHPRIEQPSGTVTGEKITFWRDQKRMDVESLPDEERIRLIIYPDQMKSPTNAVPKTETLTPAEQPK